MRVGRFAPSPTGPLHMGSLLTALASFLHIHARTQRRPEAAPGQWFVRIDDLDPPREDPGAVEAILGALAAHGLLGDRPVDFASRHQGRYQAAFNQLSPDHFYCRCSRRQLAGTSVYPGTCRDRSEPVADSAVRVRIESGNLDITDEVLGHHTFSMAQDCGDLIIRRRDGLWAYNFATAVDDGHDVTEVVRGQDLWSTTPHQVYLMHRLGLHVPRYMHIPVLCFEDGAKLSKQSHAPAIDPAKASQNLRDALQLLGQRPPTASTAWPVSSWLEWATSNWYPEQIPERLAAFKSPLQPRSKG